MELGLDRSQVARRISCALAAVVRKYLDLQPQTALVVTGGDVARSVMDALQCTQLELLWEAAPGIPALRLANGPRRGVLLLTKAGGFGGPTTLLEVAKMVVAEHAKRLDHTPEVQEEYAMSATDA